MKKHNISKTAIIAFSFFFFSFCFASAQTSEYHRVGDTIVGRSPIYFYQWWSDNWLSDTSHRLISREWVEPVIYNCYEGTNFVMHPHGEIMQYCYTDTPIKIIGIATSLFLSDFNYWDTVGLEPDFQEYLRLYDASSDDIVLLEEVPFDLHTEKRYMKVESRTADPHNNDCCYDSAINHVDYREIREYYFDKPVTVQDSFYVGHTTNGQIVYCAPPGYEMPFSGTHLAIAGGGWEIVWDDIITQAIYAGNDCTTDCEEIPYILHRYKNYVWELNQFAPNYGDPLPDTGWHWHYLPHFMLQFPIIVIDSSYIIHYECPPVENIRVGHYGEHNAVLLWDTQDEYQSYQLSYGPAGTPPDSGTFINAPINAYNLTGLDSGVHYDAYVRSICLHDSVVYSTWSDPVDIFIVDTSTHDVGIGDNRPDALLTDDGFVLVPNPATDEVTILSSVPFGRIEVFDLQGKLVYSNTLPGQTTSFRLKTADFAKGAYTVRIHTADGTVGKRLVVK